jgi:hypothetical protein
LSARQIEVCAARIANDEERDRFVRLLSQAARYSGIAAELRRSAWNVYREAVPTARKKPK